MKPQVFISYSQRDRSTAEAICSALEEREISCWIAPRDIIPGESWEAAIIRAIRNCKTMVLVFSSGSNDSPDVLEEVRQCHKRRLVIISFRVEDVEPSDALAYYLSARQWLNAFTGRMDQHLQVLAKAVQKQLAESLDKESSVGFGVAVSGSAKGLSKDWSSFCHLLGMEVARKGFSVFATNARGVGRAFYEGACESFISMGVGDFANRCKLMQLYSDVPEHRSGIRKAFLRNAHVCVFVGGTVGTREEYEIVRAAGGFALPIGASGGAAREIWEGLRHEYESRLVPLIRQAFLSLGDVQFARDQYVASAMEIIEARFADLKRVLP